MNGRGLQLCLWMGLSACQTEVSPPPPEPDDPLRPCNRENEVCGETPCPHLGFPEMLPGADCLLCHFGGPDAILGPDFQWTAAGTVYLGPSGDRHLEGATVRITGADGVVLERMTNRVGNFYTNAPIALPFSAEVSFNGETLAMATEQTDGSCNACHRCDGVAGGKLHGP